jgi:hypothetical protein
MEAKALRTFPGICFPLRRERLNANTKLTLHEAVVWSVTNVACDAWQFATDSRLLKLQRLQNNFLCTTANYPSYKQALNLHMVFKIRCVCDYTV